MKVEKLIPAIFCIIVGVLILDCFKFYYYVCDLVSELEWCAFLVWLGVEYHKRPKQNWVTVIFSALCGIELLSLVRAVWVTVYWLGHVPKTVAQLEASETIIYNNSHAWHLCGYWLILWGLLVTATTYFLCWITVERHNKR